MLDFSLIRGERYDVAHLVGLVTLDAWRDVLARLTAELQATAPPDRLIIEMTAALGYLGIPERREVGALMARHLGTCEKLAVVVQAEKITDVVSGEARRLGLDLRLFPDFDDAVAWMGA